MRVPVVGAGASIEEAKRVGAPEHLWPPSVANFAERMWRSFFHYWLPDYLISLGFDPTDDPAAQFIELSKNPKNGINIERLFAYSWVNRDKKFEYGDKLPKGFIVGSFISIDNAGGIDISAGMAAGAVGSVAMSIGMSSGVDYWENLIYHGVVRPLDELLQSAFFENGENGPRIRQLEAGKLVFSRLSDGDLVLNLNYDTLFEIAITQLGLKPNYVLNQFTGKGISIAKPHGSLNLLSDNKRFAFADPNCIGTTPSSTDNMRNWRGIVPPRFNKDYEQHPYSKMIFSNLKNLTPSRMTFWGIGMSDSDEDLIRLYRKWVASTSVLEVINPDSIVADRIAKILNKKVRHFSKLDDWLAESAVT